MSDHLLELMLNTNDTLTRFNETLERVEKHLLNELRQDKEQISKVDLNRMQDDLQRNLTAFQATVNQRLHHLQQQLEGPPKPPQRRFNIKVGLDIKRPARRALKLLLTICTILFAWYLLLGFNPFDVEWWIWTFQHYYDTGSFAAKQVYPTFAILFILIMVRVVRWYRSRF